MAYKSFFPEKEKATISDLKEALNNKFSEIKNKNTESSNLIRGYFDKIIEKLGTIPEELNKLRSDIDEIKTKINKNANPEVENPVTEGRSFDPTMYQRPQEMQKKEANKLVDKIKEVLKSAGFKIQEKTDQFMMSPMSFMHTLMYSIGKFIANMYTGKVILEGTASVMPQPFKGILTKTYNMGVNIMSGMTNLILKPLLMLSGALFGLRLNPSETNLLDGMINMLKIKDDKTAADSKNKDKNKDKKQKEEEQNMFSSLSDSITKSFSEMLFGKNNNDQRSFKERFTDFFMESMTAIFDTSSKAKDKAVGFFTKVFDSAFGKEGFITKFVGKMIAESDLFVKKITENKEFNEKVIAPIKNFWENFKSAFTDENSVIRTYFDDILTDIAAFILKNGPKLLVKLSKGAAKKLGKSALEWAEDKVHTAGEAVGLDIGRNTEQIKKDNEEVEKQKRREIAENDKSFMGTIARGAYKISDNINKEAEIQRSIMDPNAPIAEEHLENLNNGIKDDMINRGLTSEKSIKTNELIGKITESVKSSFESLVKVKNINGFELISQKLDDLTKLINGNTQLITEQNSDNSEALAGIVGAKSSDEANNVEKKEGED